MSRLVRTILPLVLLALAVSTARAQLPFPVPEFTDHKIPHAVVLYGPAAWFLLQLVDQLVQQEVIGYRWYRVALTTTIAWFPGTLVLAWHHGPRGRQPFTYKELLLLGIIGVGWLVAAVWTWVNVGPAA